jgi:hypothetical protein
MLATGEIAGAELNGGDGALPSVPPAFDLDGIGIRSAPPASVGIGGMSPFSAAVLQKRTATTKALV